MWIVYRKKDRKVVGMSALCEPDHDKNFALSEVVRGLVNAESEDQYEAVQLRHADARALVSGPIDNLIGVGGPNNTVRTVLQRPERSTIELRCDATNLHPADGLPGISADGSSFTTITVHKLNERGEPQTSRTDNNELHLRTTAGTLMSADGKEPIRSIKLKQGQASFHLLSETARRVATVGVLAADPAVRNVTMQIEFV